MTGISPPLEVSLREFTRMAESITKKNLIPVTCTFTLPDFSPAVLYSHMRSGHGFLLESMEGVPRRAVRSIIATLVQEVFTVDGGQSQSDPVGLIRTYMGEYPLIERATAGFCGGLVGYCSYDMVNFCSHGYLNAGKEEKTPVVKFMLVQAGVVLDHQAGTCTIFTSPVVQPGDDYTALYEEAKAEIAQMYSQICQVTNESLVYTDTGNGQGDIHVSTRMGKEQYEEAVLKTLEHIRAGDIFQAVISRRFEVSYSRDPFRIYAEVRDLNPSPYLYFLEFGDETIIGSSPEMLVKVDGEDLFTVPIAGTRPRGIDEADDQRLADEMLADEKERAEHLMLVDLARNDIGKVAAYGSVKVTSFMEVEKFSHVQHITSLVTGKLHDDADRFDALASCFPAGTVSGAPKLRAMQIISELEMHPRGIYAGAVGNIGFDDRLEFAIAIRTVIVRDGIASFQTGAGIVADSDPTREYEETNQKAGAMLSALRRALAQPDQQFPCIKMGVDNESCNY